MNDTEHHQLIAFDSTLKSFSVVLDSVDEGIVRYGRGSGPLYPYMADSSVFTDAVLNVMMVIDPNGKKFHLQSCPMIARA